MQRNYMAYLSNPTETRAVLEMFGFSFAKKYGQNFLIDGNTVNNIVKSAGITKEDTVLEIGPGIGTMTQVLCEHAKNVIAVEIDKRLIDVLTFTLKDYDNVTVINSDILKCNIEELCEKYSHDGKLKVVANLPYYITTPIIMELLEKNNNSVIESITVMIQKEVAERLGAEPGNKDYGAITLSINYYSDANIVMNVPSSCFMPKPNVDSAVIRMDIYDKPPVKTKDETKMFKIIKAAFSQRRKTLVNSVSGSTDIAKETILKSLNEMGLSESVRGEALSLEQFAKLSDKIIENG
ncbi:MAG: 16S rRNA (adenine(1518)-N(6)/adenine(1519)-N(6))-dimethyltransferase RsmA [Lachnospiraceae bacterium]|nr:16S rRNA (adenine(1518)-N(6)/adenine(1519)-N(6))-dimethyltransferase RsmA [Lachnospiraceae bacterium]